MGLAMAQAFRLLFPERRLPGFDLKSTHVGFAVDKVTLV
jgi:hypothetical protein